MKRFWNFIVFAAECIALGVFTIGTVAGAIAVLVGAVHVVGTEVATKLFVCVVALLFLFLIGLMISMLIEMIYDEDMFEIPPRIARKLRERFAKTKKQDKESNDGKDKKPFPKEAEDAEIVG